LWCKHITNQPNHGHVVWELCGILMRNLIHPK
jgi:hypothetical protein